MFQQPLYKRVISRVVFYSGVMLYLWIVDVSSGAELPASLSRVFELFPSLL